VGGQRRSVGADVSRICGRFQVEAIEEVAGGRQMTVAATVEREGADKPVCVAELLLRFVD
jgi:hypothetical protein